MKVLGIDLASQPKNTAACVIEFGSGGATVRVLESNWTDDRLVAAIAEADVVGIDAPFGFPVPFTEAMTAAARDVWPPLPEGATEQQVKEATEALRFRTTDLALQRIDSRIKRRPLSVTSDLISICAWRCLRLLTHPGIRKPIDRTGERTGIYEVYPAAALAVWNLLKAGYKKPQAGALRGEILEGLESQSGLDLSAVRAEVTANSPDADDKLDAVICALVARAAVRGLTCSVEDYRQTAMREGRPLLAENLHAVAPKEGWIHVPTAEALTRLRDT